MTIAFSGLLDAARARVAWGGACRDRGNLAAAQEHWEKAAQFEASGLNRELEEVRALLATS